MEDKPELVMDYYNAMLADRENKSITQVKELGSSLAKTISGSGEVKIVEIALLDCDDRNIEIVRVGQTVRLKVIAKCHQAIDDLVVGYLIKDRLGQDIFGTNTYHCQHQLQSIVRDQMIGLEFEFEANLGPGSYSIAVALHANDNHIAQNYEWVDRAVVFTVINVGMNEFVGSSWLPPRLKVLA